MSDAPVGPVYVRDPTFETFVPEQLAERSRTAGERPVAVVRARAKARFQMEATADGFTFLSDESRHGGGDGTGLAPLRYFVAGYLLCHQVWCIKMAAVMKVKLTRVEGEAQGIVPGGTRPDAVIEASDARGLSRVRCILTLDTDGATDEAVGEVVRQAAYRCPAAVTLWRAVPIHVEIVHNGRSLGVWTAGSDG